MSAKIAAGKGPQQPFSPDESVEGAVVSWMGGLSKRYKLKPWYDGDIVVQSLNYKNGKVTSVTGMDPTEQGSDGQGQRGACTGGNGRDIQTALLPQFRGKGSFRRAISRPSFNENNDDAFEAYRNNTIRNDVPISQLQRKKPPNSVRKNAVRHTERGTPNRNIVGRMLECQFKRIKFEDCLFRTNRPRSTFGNIWTTWNSPRTARRAVGRHAVHWVGRQAPVEAPFGPWFCGRGERHQRRAPAVGVVRSERSKAALVRHVLMATATLLPAPLGNSETTVARAMQNEGAVEI